MTRHSPSLPFTHLRQILALLTLTILAACGGGGQNADTTAQVSVRAQAAAVETPQAVDMKLLVISATGTQPSYNAITAILDQIGIPFDRIVLKGAKATALQMVPDTLSDGAGNGKYQGIILETGDLPYEQSPGYYPSAMTAAQWAMLWQYQRDFGVRTATMYTRAAITVSDDTPAQTLDLTYGMTGFGGRNTNNYTDASLSNLEKPVTATFTVDGGQVFSSLNSANPVIIRNAYTYFVKPTPGAAVTPLLQTDGESGGPYTIASVFTALDGRQNLAITADSNENLTHAMLTGYGVVNWITKGVFMGQRKVYLSAQPDDFFIADTIWNQGAPDPACLDEGNSTCPEYRMNGTDYNRLVTWQNALRGRTLTGDIRLEIPFNGVGYNQSFSGDPKNTLLPAVKANSAAFRWISHTWDHTSLDLYDPYDLVSVPQTQEQMFQQFDLNDRLAKGLIDSGLRFALYNTEALVQPVISGLENDTFWSAARGFGYRYILMDSSRTYDFRPTLAAIPTNTGFYSERDKLQPADKRILIIPRYPTNLFYNVTTPTEWVAEFNYLYGVNNPYFPPPNSQSWFGKDLTYPELLDIESDTLARYMLRFNANPWMFHQSNLRAYGSSNASLLSDLLDQVTNKYRAMYNLPIQSPSQVEIGQIMQARMAYNQAIAAGVKGRIVFGSTNTIELTNPSGALVNVPLTGTAFVPQGGQGALYGGQWLVTMPVAAGATITLVPAPPPQADLTIVLEASPASQKSGKTVKFTLTIENLGPTSVTNGSFRDALPSGLNGLTNVKTSGSSGASVSTLVNTAGSILTGQITMPTGSSVKVQFEATVQGTKGKQLINTATVSVPTGVNDPVPGNNTSTVTVTIQ